MGIVDDSVRVCNKENDEQIVIQNLHSLFKSSTFMYLQGVYLGLDSSPLVVFVLVLIIVCWLKLEDGSGGVIGERKGMDVSVR